MSEHARKLAKKFHEIYERLAPEFGYATRKETAIPWDDIPEGNSNKQLMIAVCDEIINSSWTPFSPDDKGTWPEEDGEYIVTLHNTTTTAYWYHGIWERTHYPNYITAWQPIPPPYKEKK